jgi:uncharacterized protein YjiS (DUF1127 family)
MLNTYNWFCGIMNFWREMSDLQKMSDRDLKDIGLNRTDVNAIACGMKRVRGA